MGMWFSGAVARQAREALGRTGVIEGDLDADGTWPPLMRAEPVQMGVLDWSWIKGYVVRKASEALGRTVVVEGALDVDWSWTPLIRAEQVRVANAPWSKEPYMLDIRRLACRIDLHALLQGRLVLPMIELVEPVVRLETSEQGEANWTVQPNQPVAADQAQAGALPMIERLSLRDGSVTYADAASNTSMTVTLAEVQATTTGPEQRLDVEGAGQVADLPFRLTGHGGALQDLMAISRILCRCSWSSISGRATSTARWRSPCSCRAWRRRCPWRACSRTSPQATRGRVDRRRRTRRRIDWRAI